MNDPLFIHDVCPCGCTKLKIPAGIHLDQLVVRATFAGRIPDTIRFSIELDPKQPMHGWESYKS